MLILCLIAVLADVRVVSTASDGNGGRPVFVVVPDTFDATQPARVQTHYHGDGAGALYGEHMDRIAELVAVDAQRVFVLPEAAGIGAQTDWSNVRDQGDTTRDALAAAGVFFIGEQTVSAHSAGGRALAKAFRNEGVVADRVVLLDCLYEPAATRIEAGLRALQPSQVVVVRGTNSAERTQRIASAFGVEPLMLGDHFATVRFALDGVISRAPPE